MRRKNIEILMAVLLLLCAVFLGSKGAVLVNSISTVKEKPVVVIDAGHGGYQLRK